MLYNMNHIITENKYKNKPEELEQQILEVYKFQDLIIQMYNYPEFHDHQNFKQFVSKMIS
jgi:hypothetical protein